jgi:hypothetical protein
MKGFWVFVYLFIALWVCLSSNLVSDPDKALWEPDSWSQAIGVALLWPLFALKYVLIGLIWLATAIGHGGIFLFS